VRVKDVEAAAPVHQHLGEARIADDRVDDQRVLARVRDAVRVILVAEGNGVLRLVEEGGRSLLRGEDLVPLSLALAVGHIHGRPPPPEDEEGVVHRGETTGLTVTPSFLASPSFAAARL
jgi:hypothetical protein